MRNPRIYQASALNVDQQITLTDDAFGHVIRVLRFSEGDEITLFNGEGNEYQAQLTNISKKSACAQIINEIIKDIESPLNIHLGQGISRGDRMDFTLQKSVELGVNTITPIFTERCGVKLTGERLAKKQQQWQKIVISACEQSGRCYVPQVLTPISIEQWLRQQTDAIKLNLHPKAQHSIMTLPIKQQEKIRIRLLIGPEGGLTEQEIVDARQANFHDILLGPRVLRTETAALAAISALQCRFGDLA